MKKTLKMIITIFILLFLVFIIYFFLGRGPEQKNILWGVNFSQKHTENLGLNWKETYLAIINDLGVKNIKLAVSWDWIEGKRNDYFFDDVDWQVKEAEKQGVKLMMVIGMKTSRWPECHIPAWAKNLPKEERENEVLKYLQEMVLRHSASSAIISWQIENEPFFPFGECPKTDEKFLQKEVELVKSLDPVRDYKDNEEVQRKQTPLEVNRSEKEYKANKPLTGQISNGVDSLKRPIIISDTGEFSLWLKAAKFGDIVGTTMYKRVWSKELGVYFYAPFPPLFYWWKAQLIKVLYGKEVQCVELQTEPWGPALLYDLPLEEQKKTMDLEKFKYNIKFAQKTGLDTFYLWGVEWWYWMKTKHNDSSIWDEAKKLFFR